MINLTTKLKAYPRMEPSILKNYYTKEQTQEIINQSLEGYVKEVENPQVGEVYGRSIIDDKLEWVNIFKAESFVAYCISNNLGGPAPEDFPTFNDIEQFPRKTDSDNKEYNISITPSTSGYLWICSNREVSKIEFISSVSAFNTNESIVKTKEEDVQFSGLVPMVNVVGKIYCYRTNIKYAAIGATYNWKITLA